MLKFQRVLPNVKKISRLYSQPAVLNEDDYTPFPVYPPIVDNSVEAKKKRRRDASHDKIRKLNTVEEKQIALNMPRYYGFRTVMFHDNAVPFNAMPIVQAYTRSHFTLVDILPELYKDAKEAAAQVVQETKHLIEDAILFEHEQRIPRNVEFELRKPLNFQIEDEKTKHIIRQINRIITNNLADKVEHVYSAQVDYEPRHEAFWFVGGVDVPFNVVKYRKQRIWLRDTAYEPVDRAVQYLGTPILTIRCNKPLKPLIPYEEAVNPSYAVPKYTYHPQAAGYLTAHRHGTNIPGYWPGDIDEFGLLSIHGRGFLLGRDSSFGEEDNIEALHCKAMKASFGWLLAQANYLGFTTFNDLTYPLATQTILTNGQLWSLYAYQLNTTTMYGEKMDENPKYNYCIGTKPMKLYESIENGKIVGFNEDVLEMVVQFYLNAPEERDYEMRPYLGVEEQVVADIEDDKKRCWLEKTFKHLLSNRSRHKLVPEVYDWEQIYKIQHNTRAFEPKRRPFELDINPFNRRLDKHLPAYIPKVLRAYPRSKKKWEQQYYPKV